MLDAPELSDLYYCHQLRTHTMTHSAHNNETPVHWWQVLRIPHKDFVPNSLFAVALFLACYGAFGTLLSLAVALKQALYGKPIDGYIFIATTAAVSALFHGTIAFLSWKRCIGIRRKPAASTPARPFSAPVRWVFTDKPSLTFSSCVMFVGIALAASGTSAQVLHIYESMCLGLCFGNLLVSSQRPSEVQWATGLFYIAAPSCMALVLHFYSFLHGIPVF